MTNPNPIEICPYSREWPEWFEAERTVLEVVFSSGQVQIERVEMTQATGTFAVAVTTEPASVTLDPNTWVLLQAVEFGKR